MMAKEFWEQFITKHGAWAFGCCAIAAAFYFFTLKPMSEERSLMLTVLTKSVADNSKALQGIDQSTEAIKDGMTLQRVSLEAFMEQVKKEHPEHRDKLDEILRKLDAN